jgi:glycosyltransferase involved in cell wall biosynthesis
MTCTLNEVACAAFTVGAVIEHVDRYVLIDTGSDDGTPDLIRALYPKHCRSGRLIIEEIGKLPDFDMSIARNRALDHLRDAGMDYFIKLDGDTVFYDAGIRQTLRAIQTLDPEVTIGACGTYELYQHEIEDDAEWIAALRDRRPAFFEMNFRPHAPVVYPLKGARAAGKWGDEEAGKIAEGIVYDRPEHYCPLPGIVAAHYGWARPLRYKRAKFAAQKISPGEDPRLDTLHVSNDDRAPVHPFSNHPEIIARQIGRVCEWFDGAARGLRKGHAMEAR